MDNNVIEKIKEELTFEKVLNAALKTPGVRIDRKKFLEKELKKYYSLDVVAKAISTNPANAGISKELIDKISKDVINYETTKVTGISVAASLPGGIAGFGAAAADITSYFVFILRTVQELAYLYGFEQFDLNEDEIDAETMNTVLLFIGVMFSVNGANTALKKFANILSKHISKKLAQKTLMKGTIYPIIKKVSTDVGIHMTKQIFADTVASTVPIIGGGISGTLTYVIFKPNCMKLRSNLRTYNLCDPDFYKNNPYGDTIDAIYEDMPTE